MTGTIDFVDPLPEVPQSLKCIPNWVRWRLEPNKDGKPTKIPYQVDGRKASSTEPNTWTAYRTVVSGASIDSTQGVGFVVNGDIVGVDLDGCRNQQTGEIASWADQIIDELDSYTEITPSKTGVRVWVRGVLPEGTKVFNLDPSIGFGSKVKVEVYAAGRYFTVTGQSCFEPSGDVEERDLTKVYQILHDIRAKHPARKKDNETTPGSTNPPNQPVQIEKIGAFETSKFDIFMHGTIVSRSPFIISNGNGRLEYPSQSEADMAFTTVLAIRHDGDRDKIDEDFQRSALHRPEKWARLKEQTISKAIESAKKIKSSSAPTLIVAENAVQIPVEDPTDPIPHFDVSVVNGIYKKFVDVVTRGTTMTPQFVYVIAKTIVGARMAGKVKFENLDVEPRFYTALIGETGSGKGEAWRRVFQILNVECKIGDVARLKIINSADSGAGIRDAFFEPPEDEPILMYIDEVESFGNKAAPTRNPAILDTLIELADSTQISRVKASRRNQKAAKTKNDARLCAVMCGQDGSVYTKAFAGRTKLGLWDRLYPEHGVAVEAGDLPPISAPDAFQLLNELNKLDYSGMMTMSVEAKTMLDSFWTEQKPEVRKKARWKKNLVLDAYMSAFGRGSKTAGIEDAEIAIKIFTRQLVIRQVCFTTEVPDRVGYYLGLIKNITGKMQRQLEAGMPQEVVAKSRRDYERETNAHRDNESHIFERAWRTYEPVWLTPIKVKKTNGQEYAKYLPESE